MLIKQQLKPGMQAVNCIADNDAAVTVLPDGRLGKCEHFSENHFIGIIYSNSTDESEIRYFKEKKSKPECEFCVSYPAYNSPFACPARKPVCTPDYQKIVLKHLQAKVLDSYMNSCTTQSAIPDWDEGPGPC